MKIHVYYPSGQNFVLEGEWQGPVVLSRGPGHKGAILVLECDGKTVLAEPRGVYVDAETDEVLYSPRNQVQIDQWVIDWLKEHPEWPTILELPGALGSRDVFVITDQAAGALPNGTLVEKVATEEGDTHVDGDRAKVLGSAVGEGNLVYFVEWLDLPGIPVGVGSQRIREVQL
ncbi:hypothetical protein LCGC14_3103240 [marine sediment metagenome]|uniref:Uncharacterized protein n=1 Tax=marine sediment metagenome TaxID=412755 RepID=A0A0F8YEM2_9ZZZZ